MEVLQWIEGLFQEYGYAVLFFGLMLEFIALPFPGETTMAYAGYLSYMGILNYAWLMIIALLGTTVGMTITYIVGIKAGLPFIERYGKWLFLTESKIKRTQQWFGKYGHSLIFIGYFIPGVRHFTGYFAGITALPFRKFALYAYSGAILWVMLFISIGKWFGPQWQIVFHLAEEYALRIALGLTVLALAFLLITSRKKIRQALSRLTHRFKKSKAYSK